MKEKSNSLFTQAVEPVWAIFMVAYLPINILLMFIGKKIAPEYVFILPIVYSCLHAAFVVSLRIKQKRKFAELEATNKTVQDTQISPAPTSTEPANPMPNKEQ